MKVLMMIAFTLFVGACAHKHGCSQGAEQKDCACDKKEAGMKAHDCADCEGGKKEKKECCSDKTCKHEGHKACTADTSAAVPAVFPLMSGAVTKNVSQEEFSQIYTKNKENLAKHCTSSAVAYCGKITKDMMVSESEASCLWSKVYRVTREALPQLDGTPCAKTIKSLKK